MAKSKGKRREGWSHEDHSARVDKRLASMAKKCEKEGKDIQDVLETKGYKRSALAHDSRDKIDDKRLKLNLTHLQREIEHLRENLTNWDEVEEAMKCRQEEEEAERKRQEELHGPLTLAEKAARKRRKMDPSNWKLRGAARPAWEVYDFDTRYVCPHLKAHEDAKERYKRLQNIFNIYRGRFATSDAPQPTCRNFLSVMMQYGTLCLEAKRFKSARSAFLECMELEGDDYENRMVITNARCRLVRMYLDQNRPESARRLFERIPQDPSAWVRYGAALVEFVSWNILKEEGSSSDTSQALLLQAFEGNIFCAYYLAFHETFGNFMEYNDDVEDEEEGTLGEAIEYCSSEQMGVWMATEGALEWVRSTLIRVCQDKTISSDKLNWNQILTNAETEFKTLNSKEDMSDNDKEYSDDGNDQDEKVDFLMCATMFRTAMEAIEDGGAISCSETPR